MNSTTNPRIIKPAGEITSAATTLETPQTPSGALVSAPAAQPWYKQRKAQIGMAAAAVAVVAACAAGIAVASNQPTPVTDTNASAAQTTPAAAHETTEVSVPLDLPEWNQDSSAALLEINDGANTTYKAITPDNAKSTKLELAPGTYTLTLTSPINADGAIYIVSDPQTLTVDSKQTNANVPLVGSRLSPENVTEDQINAIKDKFSKAEGSGSVSKSDVEKVTNNAAAGADARNSKTDEEKKDAQNAAKQDTQSAQESAGGNASSGTSGQTVQTGASGGSASSGGSTGGSSSSSSGSSSADSTPAPTHTHSWQPVYRTVHHDAVTEQSQEPIYEWHTVCTVCGAVTPSRDHIENHMLNHEGSGTHSENVIVGYNTVTKTVQAAYDEQVLDHYACSCGATQ